MYVYALRDVLYYVGSNVNFDKCIAIVVHHKGVTNRLKDNLSDQYRKQLHWGTLLLGQLVT